MHALLHVHTRSGCGIPGSGARALAIAQELSWSPQIEKKKGKTSMCKMQFVSYGAASPRRSPHIAHEVHHVYPTEACRRGHMVAEVRRRNKSHGAGPAGGELGGDDAANTGMTAWEDEPTRAAFRWHKRGATSVAPCRAHSWRHARDDHGSHSFPRHHKWSPRCCTRAPPSGARRLGFAPRGDATT